MKAWVLHGVNDIRYEAVDEPQLADNEVLVSVKAAGICGSDIPRIYQTGAHVHPLIPGHEFSGQVAAVGRNADKKWSDKRVGIFPLIPCRNCDACQRQQYELCRSYSYLGSRRDGGFAEFVAVPEWNLLALPDSVAYEQAAMMEPMAVAVHAMRSALVENGDKSKSIAVCGLGTIGMLLVMFLKEAGYTNIYVMGNKDFQRKMAAETGIDGGRIYGSQTDGKGSGAHEWLMTQTKGAGVDVFFECVGKNETISDAIMGTAPNGTVQLVGNPASDIMLEKNIYWKILRAQLTVKGSWNSSYKHSADDDWHYVLDRLQNGSVHPERFITHFLSLDELEKGFLFMRDKTQAYVKVMACEGGLSL
ncbi:MAG: galactitol-1-phosphate 5-dehydrogenase [Lachnospiraceae bacterium]|nr:galactitol-1-phosphate 5-dehydrogenase [Lachnospiraceae bacterium]